MNALRIGVALTAVLLAACAPSRSVRVEPVEDPSRPAHAPVRVTPAPGTYLVARGDTLYGIAFRHGLDYRDVARANGIAPPYTIYPGQTLRLDGPGARSATPPRPAPAARAGGGVIASTARTSPDPEAARVPPPAATTSAPAATATAPRSASGSPTTAAGEVGASAPPPASATPAPTQVAALPSGPVRWSWPAAGRLVGTFLAGDPTRQGINIAGQAGEPVRAAAAGVVVYSGAGLIGYGELVIVKHTDEWLSAYGHNRKRLVAEGEAVGAGQQIAEMGRSGASRDMLHFEIRRSGKPVDPLALLPKR